MDRDLAGERAALRRLINGFQVSQALYVGVRLGVPDRLAGGPRTCVELAPDVGADPEALYRLLRALAAVGVLEEGPDRLFSLTALGQGLVSDAPMSLGGWAEWIGHNPFWATWGHLWDSVRTGQNAFQLLHGTDVWSYRSSRPEELALFARAMTSLSGAPVQAVIEAYDFGRFDRVVDVGGSRGSLLAAILSRNPQARGVLLDRPGVVAGARQELATAGVGRRCDVVGGDFFESVPAGGGAYVLKSVLHDWPDPDALRILRSCGRAMAPGAVLLLVERVVGAPNEGADIKLDDLNMLVMTGGRERTLADWESLLAAAGLALVRVVATRSAYSVIEASAGPSA
ncbi:MAG: acetylserotonin O-methyltransferase [Candidatus Dormibacteraeota bacterium]|nr:acetylserotonin O-methyltransferase [Candidatus Dormibacteraeota bacterium]